MSVAPGCDDLCQNLKKAFEARANGFEERHTAKPNDGSSLATLRLSGAKGCMVNEVTMPQSGGRGTQFVCYWQEASISAAEARFRDLVSRLQVLVPSNWSTGEDTELDDPTGADLVAWHAVEPGGGHDVRIYALREFVGLHMTAYRSEK